MRLRIFRLTKSAPILHGAESAASQPLPGRVAAIGNFDGVHRGHKEVLRILVRQARERQLTAAVISFYPHPRIVINRAAAVAPLGAPVVAPFVLQPLSPLRAKMALLRDAGVDELVLVHFTDAVRELTAKRFVESVLVAKLDVRHLVLGYDTRIGKGRAGDSAIVLQALAAHGRSGEVVALLGGPGGALSSREARLALGQADLDTLVGILGRRYVVSGKIIHGAGRGKTLGFPTANVYFAHQMLPPTGVYAGFAVTQGGRFAAVANIGRRPTFDLNGTNQVSLEVHVLDTGGDSGSGVDGWHGQRLDFEVVQRIRNERKFADAPELIAQITRDIEQARVILAATISIKVL